ncbi:hypothetical protein [Alienimonas chondri]|uniref:Uncharacterized protein n=1 Tax=Alienimonas chondri TaxID=2681879 RepID=A0ABX1VJT8_9PLAN|nr:hypothetical protein [Alienimonas chondri]NNJ28065.1 hypothetical protein [Alienimonas chondri]
MEGLPQQFLEHPRRSWFVWGAVAAVGLALTLPAWESYAAATEARRMLEADLFAAEAEAATLPALTERLTALKEQPSGIDGPRGLDEATSERLREEVVKKIADAGCRYRRLTLDPPVVTPWLDGPPPLPGLAALSGGGPAATGKANPEKPVKFELVTRRLEAEAVGATPQIAGLLTWATTAHPHSVPLEYELSFEEDADSSARSVHLTFTLLLTAVRPVKKAGPGS